VYLPTKFLVVHSVVSSEYDKYDTNSY